uniref:Phosphatidic acid phosphatase type 2/haloperoxidase domain-containing protein n=1 Tax=Panagrolaimus sp. JU765 TaxID=591449 RepID=A0AC34QVL5_9BILA
MFSRHFVVSICSIPLVLVLRWIACAIPYARTGFFCDDDEIRYPHKEDTIPGHLMFFLFSCFSVPMFLIGEFSLIRHLSRKGKRVYQEADKLAHPSFENFFYVISMMICGDLATSAVVNFIADYECLGQFDEEEYYSFPSGHSAHSVFLGIFLIVYIQKRCKLVDPIRSLLQLCLAGFVFFICTSRVRDSKHRLSDVCGGAVLGAAISLFFITHVANFFRHARYQTTDQGIMHHQGYQTVETEDYQSFLPKVVISRPTSDYGSVVSE